MCFVIHANVWERLQTSRAEMTAKQHKRAIPITIKDKDNAIVRLPERSA